MAKTSKPFAVLATAWKRDQFFRARLKLSLIYVAIIAAIVLTVSVLFYDNARRHVETFPANFPQRHVFDMVVSIEPTDEQEAFVETVKEQIIVNIIEVDALILLIVFFLSYSLAEYTLRPIKETMDRQKRFIADASHELRTPLSVVRASLDVFERTTPRMSADVRELIESVREETHRLGHIGTQMIELARADAIMPDMREFDVGKMADGQHARFAKLAHEKHVELSAHITQPIMLCGNEHLLAQAVSNLLDNALKYTPAGGTITLECKVELNHLIIIVSDTGVGISERDAKRIFDRFYQADVAKGSEGTGLGLSIVSAGVERHHGTITVQSSPGKGSTFRMSIPLT